MTTLAQEVTRLTAGTGDALTDGKVDDLQLAYLRVDGRRKLRISRRDKPPTQGQVRAVLAAFGVPEDSAITAGRVKERQPGTGRIAVAHYAEVTWREVAHAATIAPTEAA